MSDRRVTDSEIVDALLRGAEPEVKARVDEAVRSNLECAASHKVWACALPALAAERERASLAAERVSGRVMAALERGEATGAACRPRRLGGMAGLALAACAVTLIAVAAFSLLSPADTPMATHASADGGSGGMTAPATQVADLMYIVRAGDGAGSAEQGARTYHNLASAIEAAPLGGVVEVRTEGGRASTPAVPRLTKRVRIEARQGVVRIGAVCCPG